MKYQKERDIFLLLKNKKKWKVLDTKETNLQWKIFTQINIPSCEAINGAHGLEITISELRVSINLKSKTMQSTIDIFIK